MFSDQERKAFELGRRMAQAEFSPQDNPFTVVNPRLAMQWQHGYAAANALIGLTSALARPMAQGA